MKRPSVNRKVIKKIRELAGEVVSLEDSDFCGGEVSFKEAFEKIFNGVKEPEEEPKDRCEPVLVTSAITEKSLMAVSKFYSRYDNKENIQIEYVGRPGDWASWAHVVPPLGYVQPLHITEYAKNIIRRVNMTNLGALKHLTKMPIRMLPTAKNVPFAVTVLHPRKGMMDARGATWMHEINVSSRGAQCLSERGLLVMADIIDKFYSPMLETKYAEYYMFLFAEYMICSMWRNHQISLLDTPHDIGRTLIDVCGSAAPLSAVCVAVRPKSTFYWNALQYETFYNTNERKNNIKTGKIHAGVTYKDFFSYENFYMLRKYVKSDVVECDMDVHTRTTSGSGPARQVPLRHGLSRAERYPEPIEDIPVARPFAEPSRHSCNEVINPTTIEVSFDNAMRGFEGTTWAATAASARVRGQ